MTLLFDENISARIVKALRILINHNQYEILGVRDMSWEGMKDHQWLPLIKSDENWVIISGDNRIIRNPIEKKLWRDSQSTIFCLDSSWANVFLYDRAWSLIRWWPTIVEAYQKFPNPSALKMPFRYTQNGIRPVR